MPSDKFRQRNPKNKQTKFQLLFDEDSRKDFLTGFQKRKKARKKIAQQEAEEKRKEERRKERRERRDALEEELKRIRLPEVTEKKQAKQDVAVFDHPEHTVTVTSITSMDLEKEHGGVGDNKVDYEDEDIDGNDDDDVRHAEDEDDDDHDDISDIPQGELNGSESEDEAGKESRVQAHQEGSKTKEIKDKKKAICDKKRRLLKKQALRRRKKGSQVMARKMKSMKRKTLGKFIKRGSASRRPKR